MSSQVETSSTTMKEFNLESLVRETVKYLKPYSSARDEYVSDGSKMIFLDANENPFENGLNRYPDPQQRSLKALFAEQRAVREENILLGNGSDEVLDLIFRAFCEPNVDNIITMPPTYGMYKVLSNINAVENHEVLLTSDFELNTTKILEEVDNNTKLMFVCSPNNPTGNIFSKESIQKLLEEFQGLVVIDEAYIDFANTDSWVNRLNDFPNLVVTQTLSKAYGMAGIRLGICYASDSIIAVLNKIKPPYNVNQLTQYQALKRVLDDTMVQEEVQKVLKERDILIRALNQLRFVKKVYPSDANFVLAMVDNADMRYNQLLAEQIVVRNRSNQPLCENTLRFTVGTSEENEKLISILKEMN